jgi:membrane-bound metal-dependent hydrolase YbcI (DUF457 family)
MDVVTHGLAGALVAHAITARSPWPAVAAAVGGAVAPDLDVLARLWDPLAPITVHRVMTHSLVGGTLVAAGVAGVVKACARRHPFRALAGAAYLGVLSHIGLDLLNPFGTAVLWPVTARRVGLGWLYVIDPVVIALVVVGLLLTGWSTASRTAVPRWTLGLLAAYALLSGAVSGGAAAQWTAMLNDRGIVASHTTVVPTFPGPLRWVGVAEADGALYRAAFSLGRPSGAGLAVFPKVSVDGVAGLERMAEVRTFRAFARFVWLTVRTDGELRQVEYRDLAFEDHPLGGPMALRLTVDRSGAVRALELGHKL